ncbi:MAG TPA: YihY/virulence factor BrkB family protein [Marmoricola sp.]|nr:YihY/virulence factor BrkB family protein [Marmoricola sp.]
MWKPHLLREKSAQTTDDGAQSRRDDQVDARHDGRPAVDVRESAAPTRPSEHRPHPDDARKPDSPTDVTKPSWKYSLKNAVHEFSEDQCTDLAASLTYYAVLSLFPAVIALVSLLGVVGQGRSTTDALLNIVQGVAPSAAIDTIRGPIENLVNNQKAGLGLVLGLLTALWSASGYVGAFGRAMNRVYEVEEGRPFWKLRPVQILVTLVALVLVALVALALVVTGPVAQAVGDTIGLGNAAVTAWSIAKWPVMVAVVILVIAILYWATPNIRQPKFRWVSMGSVIALLVWVVASVAFAFYVANFGSYNKTYGALAGAVVFLLWLWLTNLALLFGAEFDAEVERGRELQAGLPAEESIQLPVRDDSGIEKNEKKAAERIEKARTLRETHGERL